jgi:hypothetical protein
MIYEHVKGAPMKGKYMTRFVVVALMAGVAVLAAAASSSSPASVTFNKNVLPILQKNCQICHRLDQVAPTSLIIYLSSSTSSRPFVSAGAAANAAFVIRRLL